MPLKALERELATLNNALATNEREKTQASGSLTFTLNRLEQEASKIAEERAEILAVMDAHATIQETQAALTTLQQAHSACPGEKAALTNQRDAAQAQVNTLQSDKAHLNTLLDAANSQTGTLTSQLASANATIALKDQEIAGLRAQLGPQFKVYNEWKSKPNMTAEKMPPIRFIYENEITAPGEQNTDPPNLAHLDDKFADILASDPTTKMVILDQEAWLNNNAIGANLNRYIALVNKAKEFFPEVAVYMLPRRSYSFLTGTTQENIDRKASLIAEAQGQQALWDAVTFFSPSFYYLNPIHLNAAKRDEFITHYHDLCNILGPGKKQIPTLYPIIHNGVPQVDLRGTWISGDYFKATLDKIYDTGFTSVAIFGQTSDPDPIATNMDWLVNGVRPFIAARGLTP